MKKLLSSAGVLLTGALALVGGGILFGGCSKPAPRSDVVALVGTNEIRVGDLEREAGRRRLQKRSVPEATVLLEEMIEHETLLQKARRAGVDRDPQVARELDNLLISRLLEKEVAAQTEKITVTAEEVQSEYAANPSRHTQPAKTRLAILFQEAGRSSSPARRTEARTRIEEARAKFLAKGRTPLTVGSVPGFGALALEYSDDQASRYRSGDIGWMEVGRTNYHWPRAVIEAGLALPVGTPSEVLETDAGYWLVLGTDHRSGSVKSLAEVEPALRQSVLLKKRRAVDQTFRQQSRQEAGVVIQTNVLAGVKLPASEQPPVRRETEPPSLPVANAAQP